LSVQELIGWFPRDPWIGHIFMIVFNS